MIHTVGPVWQGGKVNEPQILESCYCNSMNEANRLGCSSISFPSISTETLGYPMAQAATIAVRTVADLLHKPEAVLKVRFVLFDGREYDAYTKAAEELASVFPHFNIRADTQKQGS